MSAAEREALLAEIASLRSQLTAAVQERRFSPLGDNHHNAAACPYCRPTLEADQARLEKAEAALSAPIPMLLFCPACGEQHVDEPDDRTPGWINPPHKSHLCHGCRHIWRPCDRPTNGVAKIETVGKSDSPPVAPVTRAALSATEEVVKAGRKALEPRP